MLARFPSTHERVGGRRGNKKKTDATKQADNKSNHSPQRSAQQVAPREAAAACHPAAAMCANPKHEPERDQGERDQGERDIFEGAQALVLLEEGGLQTWVQVVLRLPLPSCFASLYPHASIRVSECGAKANRE